MSTSASYAGATVTITRSTTRAARYVWWRESRPHGRRLQSSSGRCCLGVSDRHPLPPGAVSVWGFPIQPCQHGCSASFVSVAFAMTVCHASASERQSPSGTALAIEGFRVRPASKGSLRSNNVVGLCLCPTQRCYSGSGSPSIMVGISHSNKSSNSASASSRVVQAEVRPHLAQNHS